MSGAGRPRATSRSADLTDIERRIAVLVALGRRNREVAAELAISAKTVEWHLSRVYRKLGVRSRVELAALGAGGFPWDRGSVE